MRTLTDRLDELAAEFGVHPTDQLSVRVDDLRDDRRRDGPDPGGHPGHAARTSRSTAVEDLLPDADVVILRTAAARVVVRPSGTEPKLKAYLEVVEPVADGDVPDGPQPGGVGHRRAARRDQRRPRPLTSRGPHPPATFPLLCTRGCAVRRTARWCTRGCRAKDGQGARGVRRSGALAERRVDGYGQGCDDQADRWADHRVVGAHLTGETRAGGDLLQPPAGVGGRLAAQPSADSIRSTTTRVASAAVRSSGAAAAGQRVGQPLPGLRLDGGSTTG